MEINREAIKGNAKLVIAKTKPSPILVSFVYVMICFVLEFLVEKISGEYDMVQKTVEQYAAGNMDFVPDVPEISGWGHVLIIALSVMAIMMFVGFTIYRLQICQFRKAGIGNLFDGFGMFSKSLWLIILECLLMALLTCLLFVPGIVAFYRYRQALNLMIENPEMSAFDCLRLSSQMMSGHKGEMFLLDLSLLGWFVLTIIPGVIIWVAPYAGVTYTNYYLALRDMPHSTFDATV